MRRFLAVGSSGIMTFSKAVLFPSILLLLLSCSQEDIPLVGTTTNDIYFVDAHSQVDDQLEDLNIVLTRMDENNVKKTILSSRGGLTRETLLDFANDNNTQIIPAIRTKGGSDNSEDFTSQLESDSANVEYGAIAEFLSYHDAKESRGAPEVAVSLSDDKTLAALAVAQEKGWPFVVHIEFASLSTLEKDRYMQDLKTMLDSNPNTPIILIHMGQLQLEEVRTFIHDHNNIYFMTSHTDPVTVENSEEPWTALFENGSLKIEWKLLMTEYPTRFIFALDNVWANHWDNRYGKVMGYWKDAMGSIDGDAAAQIAHLNAERLWNIRSF